MVQLNTTSVLKNGMNCRYAELRGGSTVDAEAWRDDYEAGKTPVEAYCDEWGDE
ncbi:hypothetical protein ACLB1E_18820 [Escherichia coli]